MALSDKQLMNHIIESHGVDEVVAKDVIGPVEGNLFSYAQYSYLRGWHDGSHGRVDADEIQFALHKGHDVDYVGTP